MMPRKPDSEPSAKAETAEATGILKTRHDDQERGDDAVERRVGRRDAEVHVALRIAVPVQRDEVQQRQDRDGGDDRGKKHVPHRVVVLLIHTSPYLTAGLAKTRHEE